MARRLTHEDIARALRQAQHIAEAVQRRRTLSTAQDCSSTESVVDAASEKPPKPRDDGEKIPRQNEYQRPGMYFPGLCAHLLYAFALPVEIDMSAACIGIFWHVGKGKSGRIEHTLDDFICPFVGLLLTLLHRQ